MRTFLKCLTAALALAALVATFSGCGRHNAPLAPSAVHTNALHGMALPPASVQHMEGSVGPGSTYYLDVPEDWNHELVIYAHGITLPPDLPIAQPNYLPLRDSLLARGFAVAASTFDFNGYALKNGFVRTHQLSSLFAERFGTPARTYLLGKSLGAIVSEKLVETFPAEYDGFLSVSGVLGGTRAEVDYIGTIRVLFDLLYPGMLPGDVCQVPPMTPQEFQTHWYPMIRDSLIAHPDRLGIIAALMGPRLEYGNPTELVGDIVMAFAFQLLDDSDLYDQAHGHCPFDNHDVVYDSPALPQALLDWINANVDRYTATPDAVAYIEHYYQPTGELLIPMVTLHNIRDPQVPSWHEDMYRALVNAKGHGDNLYICKIDPWGHNTFNTAQVMVSFMTLVNWVEHGVTPTTCPAPVAGSYALRMN